MIPKNHIRGGILDRNLIVHDGLYHDHIAQKLPQFVDLPPENINDLMGLNSMSPENSVVTFESDPLNPPEEFKDYKREIDVTIGIPDHLLKPLQTHVGTSRRNEKMAKQLRSSYKGLKRFKKHMEPPN